tara:strand:- start:5112 stop:5663 length:552 start_codon:yes stop_codon:yes gene_type:complete
VIIVKKYSNRRLYDTDWSRYVTLEELAGRIRDGEDVRVVDAKTSADLTQLVLAQIILESRGAAKLLPASLLAQLIRMEEADLAAFFGQYMTWALQVYQQSKKVAAQMGPLGGLAQAPFQASNAMARLLSGWGPWNLPGLQPPGVTPTPLMAPEPDEDEGPTTKEEMAALRAEIEALKASLQRD